MKIEVKYEVCIGTHMVAITLEDINEMLESGELTVTHKLPSGKKKTTTITGTHKELFRFAELLHKVATQK